MTHIRGRSISGHRAGSVIETYQRHCRGNRSPRPRACGAAAARRRGIRLAQARGARIEVERRRTSCRVWAVRFASIVTVLRGRVRALADRLTVRAHRPHVDATTGRALSVDRRDEEQRDEGDEARSAQRSLPRRPTLHESHHRGREDHRACEGEARRSWPAIPVLAYTNHGASGNGPKYPLALLAGGIAIGRRRTYCRGRLKLLTQAHR